MNEDDKGSTTGVAMIWGAVLIFTASSSVVGLLAQLRTTHLVDGRNVISFCNVLFVRNLCALIAHLIRFHGAWTRDALKALKRSNWFAMTAVALLSGAIALSLLFLGLENTTVTNVVLVGRIEPALILLLGWIIPQDKPDIWIALGTGLGLAGAATVFVLQGPDMNVLGKSELQAAGGSAALALSMIISKRFMGDIPMGIFSVYRNALGKLIFFVAAVYLFGFGHFMDVFSPFPWQWMVVYGAVVVFGGQMLWFRGMA